MTRRLSLIVTDTSPLITLAVADSLGALLLPGLPVALPDAVYFEATRVRTAAGASRLVEWINANAALVRIVPTEIGVDQQRRLEEGRTIRGLGEQAAIEVLDRLLTERGDVAALLLFEDTDLLRRHAVVDERVTLVSTGDFLRGLQAARLIQSADQILDDAARAGRNVGRQRSRPGDDGAAPIVQAWLNDRPR